MAKLGHPVAFCRIQMGRCRVCQADADLRCEVCFQCSGKVSGRKTRTGHLLWETGKPSNQWRVDNKGLSE